MENSNHLRVYEVMELLAEAGDGGLTTTEMALEFTSPQNYQMRSNRVSQIMRKKEVEGLTRRGEQEGSPLWRNQPVYRWYATPQAAAYLAEGTREQKAARKAEAEVEAFTLRLSQAEHRQDLLAAARSVVLSGPVTKCWRYRTVMELREEGCILSRIGEVFGLTKERVRQIEAGVKDSCRCHDCV